jgi:Flp pilus assembly protein CpaB
MSTGALSQPSPSGRGQPKEVWQVLKTVLKRHRLLVSALVLGLAASVLSFRLLSLYVVTRPVLVTTRAVDGYQKVTSADVKIAYLPAGGIPVNALTALEQAIGRYTRMPLVKGQALQADHVSNEKEEIGLSAELPQETRGLFIPASAAHAVGGLLRRGEKVDVICASKGPAYGQTMVFRDVPVVEVVRDQSSQEFRGALVLLSPAECELVASSLDNSNVYLSLVPRDSADYEAYAQGGRIIP